MSTLDELKSLLREILVNVNCPDSVTEFDESFVGSGFYGEVMLALDDRKGLVCTYDHYNAGTDGNTGSRRTTFMLRDRESHGSVEVFYDHGPKFSVRLKSYEPVMDILHAPSEKDVCDLCWSLDNAARFGKGK